MFKNLDLSALGVLATTTEIIELTLSHGFKGVNFDLVGFHEQVQVRGLPGSRRLYDSAKLLFGSFPLPIDWLGDDATFATELKRLEKLGALAKEINLPRATVVLEASSDERAYHENFELTRKRLAEIGQLFEPLGIQLGVGFQADATARASGTHQFISSLDQLLTLLSMVGADNVGLLVDTWQWHLAGADPSKVGDLQPGQIVAVIVSDAPSELDAATATEEMRLLPGETGTIDNVEYLKALAQSGYEGPVTPIAFPGRLKGQKRDQIVAVAGRAVENVFLLAGLSPAPASA